MNNSIELLDAVGRDARLRHASAEELQRALSAMHASDGLLHTAASGDRDSLIRELGPVASQVVQSHDSPVQGGFEDEQDTQDDSREGNGETPAGDRS